MKLTKELCLSALNKNVYIKECYDDLPQDDEVEV